MNKLMMGIAVAAVALGLVGCEDANTEKTTELSFENQSSETVSVIPLSIEWGAFRLPPGEMVALKNIKNPDFYYEPATRVQEAANSTERRVIFVNSPPSGK